MMYLVVLGILVLAAVLVCQILLLRRPAPVLEMTPVVSRIDALDRGQREEFATNRREVGTAVAGFNRDTREEFERIRQRLAEVDKAIGEMRSLAVSVGDLKRVLTNVRARGLLGEVQLERLLDDMLVRGQFDKNVAVRRTNERVEFAIQLPGESEGQTVWLPIDAKFPTEDYDALRCAHENGDPVAAEACAIKLKSASASTHAASTRSTSSRLTPPTSASSISRLKASTPRSSAAQVSLKACSATGVSPSPAPQRWQGF